MKGSLAGLPTSTSIHGLLTPVTILCLLTGILKPSLLVEMALFTPRKAVKVALLFSFCGFLLINFQFLTFGRGGTLTAPPSQIPNVQVETLTVSRKPRANLAVDPDANISDQVKPVQQIHIVPKEDDRPAKLTTPPKNNSSSSQTKHKDDSSGGQDKRDKDFNQSLNFIITDINDKQQIHNIDQFPPSGSNGTSYRHVWAVQVHNRDHYLKYLVDSLKTVRGINSSLLIVSHDFYSKEVFDIVSSIDFMPVSMTDDINIVVLQTP